MADDQAKKRNTWRNRCVLTRRRIQTTRAKWWNINKQGWNQVEVTSHGGGHGCHRFPESTEGGWVASAGAFVFRNGSARDSVETLSAKQTLKVKCTRNKGACKSLCKNIGLASKVSFLPALIYPLLRIVECFCLLLSVSKCGVLTSQFQQPFLASQILFFLPFLYISHTSFRLPSFRNHPNMLPCMRSNPETESKCPFFHLSLSAA